MSAQRTNERTDARRVISYRGPVSGAVITGERMGEHELRPAAALYWRVLDAGVIQRLDLLDEALERARREGAAEALEAAALDADCRLDVAGLLDRANALRADLQ